MKILLLQARNADDPMVLHELECFSERCELDPKAFQPFNFAVERFDDFSVLGRVDAVMVGGSGDYSMVSADFDWHGTLLDVMRDIVRRGVPMFASCFGFQALVQALGGQLVSDRAYAEVGSFEIYLTAEGRQEPLFAEAPPSFTAQLGHNDSATVDLPDGFVRLAHSDRAPVQAVRLAGAPIVATQFHPELSMDANMVRYLRYLQGYAPGLTREEAEVEARRIHRPSPFANGLLRRFLDLYVVAES